MTSQCLHPVAGLGLHDNRGARTRAGRGTIAAMLSSRWPLADLRLQTPDLELRWPSLDDLGVPADLAAAGVHDPEVQPFMVPWTDAPPDRAPVRFAVAAWRDTEAAFECLGQ